MFAKRGVEVNLFLAFMLFVALLPVLVVAQTGQECDAPGNALSTCGGGGGISVSTLGHGAVELCGVCHKCGDADGVCPEDYSDGRNEINSAKINVGMRVTRDPFSGDEFSVAFETGNQACASIGGNCTVVQKHTGFLWYTIPSANCDTNFSLPGTDHNFLIRAQCANVPRKAGCEYCPDPDCQTLLSGKTFDSNTGSVLNGVTVSADWAPSPYLSIVPDVSDEYGNYMLNAVTGRLNVTCSRQNYTTYTTTFQLQRGRNIFDCYMNNLTCTAQCTTINSSGSEVCQPACDGFNGCQMSDDAQILCANKVPGITLTINSTVYTNSVNNCSYNNITTLNCCKGEINNYQQLIIGSCPTPPSPPGGCEGAECNIIQGGLFSAEVDNIITRNYRKELNGLPVTLKIIVYRK